jgi:hypothetical protein
MILGSCSVPCSSDWPCCKEGTEALTTRIPNNTNLRHKPLIGLQATVVSRSLTRRGGGVSRGVRILWKWCDRRGKSSARQRDWIFSDVAYVGIHFLSRTIYPNVVSSVMLLLLSCSHYHSIFIQYSITEAGQQGQCSYPLDTLSSSTC